MNLPNKITLLRIFMTMLMIVILIFPFEATGIPMQKLFVNESIVIDVKYLVAGFLFMIAAVTDFLDGFLARRTNRVTDFGKMLDAIADKVLVNCVLVALASTGFIHPIIPIIIIFRDIVVDSIKMIAGNKGKVIAAIQTGKWKTACMMIGIILTLFYNLPFELINIRVSDILLILGCVLSIISGVQYFQMNRDIIMEIER